MNCGLQGLLFILILPFIFPSKLLGQNIQFEWVKTINTPSSGDCQTLALDSNRDVLVAGFFRSTVDFDPGAGVFNLTSVGGTDCYIAKYDTSGNFIWAKQIGGNDDQAVYEIKRDKAGNFVITGLLQGTVDLDPGPGVFNLTSQFSNTFILKLDNAGNFIWAEQLNMGGVPTLEIDASDDIILGGEFGETQDFDPGPSTFFATGALSGSLDMFILKLDSEGRFKWFRQIKNLGGANYQQQALESDLSNNIYFGGNFTGSADFDPGTSVVKLMNDPIYDDGFILKLNPQGDFEWVRQMGGSSITKIFALQVDDVGNVYSTGFFNETADFDPGPSNYFLTGPSSGAEACFISKLDKNGNFVFAKNFADGESEGNALALDRSNNIYISGYYHLTVDFDPGPGVYNNAGSDGYFTTKLDKNGDFKWVADYQMSIGRGGGPNAVQVDVFNNVYTCGIVPFTIDFDPNSPVYTAGPGGHQTDIFIHKLSQCKAALNKMPVKTCASYTLNNITYDSTGTYYQTLSSRNGCDSIIELDLTIRKNLTQLSFVKCDSFLWNEKLLSASGVYRDTFHLANGCDSIVELDLTITKIFKPVNISACGSYLWNSTLLTKGGIYRDTFHLVNGCDSIVELNLVIEKIFKQVELINCGSYLWNNTLLATSGIYRDTFRLAGGCDSIVELNLVIEKIFKQVKETRCSSYVWNATTLLSSGVYLDTFHLVNGCDSIVELTLIINELPEPELGRNDSICIGESIVLSPGSFNEYLWSDNTTGNILAVKEPGIFWVKVTDNNQCSVSDTITITASSQCSPFYIPSAFTPNNDGLNDLFRPLINLSLTNYSFQIFNRWGQKVFYTNDKLRGWDGKVQSNPQDTGTFAYFIRYENNGKSYLHKGSFILIR